MQRTWLAGHPVPNEMATRAEGLQTRVPFDNTQRIMRDAKLGLDDFLLVEDAEMDEATRLLNTDGADIRLGLDCIAGDGYAFEFFAQQSADCGDLAFRFPGNAQFNRKPA